ncbi:MAG: PIG-L deacetylase family protein [Verrucomicrobiia bacterium]|jgi:LmbE family N-acetylglucosaminyl deacetylase
MITLNLNGHTRGPLTVLCLGAHADDIEIGCGGTLLKLTEENRDVTVHWVVLSATPQRVREARRSAQVFLHGTCAKKVIIKNFRDSYFPFMGERIKKFIQQLSREVSPDLIFTHRRRDLHQDHRLLAELTWNAFRDHLILEYEIPKYDGDMGAPNTYVHLGKDLAERKVRHICDQFKTQRSKQWFSEDTFLALLRLRGIESNSPSKYAEAFYCQKMLLL